VFDGSEAVRFMRNVVRTARIATSTDANYDGIGRGPGMFMLSGTPTAGKTVKDVEQALRSEVSKIVAEGVTEDELQRVKAQAVASHVYERDSMFFQARQIGSFAMVGLPPTFPDLFVEKLKQVTAEQVQAVAKKYLVDDRLTVAYLDPQPLDAKKPSAPPAGLHHGQ
jgi:zinc protease